MPNNISTNSQNDNNKFKIFKNEKAKAKINAFHVYDRLSNLVFDRRGLDFDAEDILNGEMEHSTVKNTQMAFIYMEWKLSIRAIYACHLMGILPW